MCTCFCVFLANRDLTTFSVCLPWRIAVHLKDPLLQKCFLKGLCRLVFPMKHFPEIWVCMSKFTFFKPSGVLSLAYSVDLEVPTSFNVHANALHLVRSCDSIEERLISSSCLKEPEKRMEFFSFRANTFLYIGDKSVCKDYSNSFLLFSMWYLIDISTWRPLVWH